MAELALKVEDLGVNYGPVRALHDVTFSLEAGHVCGLVGMNGSGKSSLIKAIVGTVRSRGNVEVYGSSVRLARRAGLVGYVPQNEGVDWDFPLSVEEVVTMGRYGLMGPTRRARREDREAVDRAIELVELGDLRKRQVGALSGGQRKRVFVARAIAQGARLLLLDEPFAGVDKPSEIAITELLRKLAAEGETLLVATHDLAGLPELCDDVLLVLRTVIFHGSAADAMNPSILGRAFGMESATTDLTCAAADVASGVVARVGTPPRIGVHKEENCA